MSSYRANPYGSLVAQSYNNLIQTDPWSKVGGILTNYVAVEDEKARQKVLADRAEEQWEWAKQAQKDREDAQTIAKKERKAKKAAYNTIAQGPLADGTITTAYENNIGGLKEYGDSLAFVDGESEAIRKEKELAQQKLGDTLVAKAAENPETMSSLYARAIKQAQEKTGYVPQALLEKQIALEEQERKDTVATRKALISRADDITETLSKYSIDSGKAADKEISSVLSNMMKGVQGSGSSKATNAATSSAMGIINSAVDKLVKDKGLDTEVKNKLTSEVYNLFKEKVNVDNVDPRIVAKAIETSLTGNEDTSWVPFVSNASGGIDLQKMQSILDDIAPNTGYDDSGSSSGGSGSAKIVSTANERNMLAMFTKAEQAKLAKINDQLLALNASPLDNQAYAIGTDTMRALNLPKPVSTATNVTKPTAATTATVTNGKVPTVDVKLPISNKLPTDKEDIQRLTNMVGNSGKTDEKVVPSTNADVWKNPNQKTGSEELAKQNKDIRDLREKSRSQLVGVSAKILELENVLKNTNDRAVYEKSKKQIELLKQTKQALIDEQSEMLAEEAGLYGKAVVSALDSDSNMFDYIPTTSNILKWLGNTIPR